MKLLATKVQSAESNSQSKHGSEVMVMTDEKFNVTELAALRSDLLQGGIDSREAAELLQVFLMGRGYGVSQDAARDAASRVEGSGCNLEVIQKELESIAMVN